MSQDTFRPGDFLDRGENRHPHRPSFRTVNRAERHRPGVRRSPFPVHRDPLRQPAATRPLASAEDEFDFESAELVDGIFPSGLDRETFGFPAEALRRQRELAQQAELSQEVEDWFETYFQVGHRKRFLWKWCVHGAALTTLPSVCETLRDHVRDTKVLSIMLCVLLDDMADEERNPELLEALLEIVEKQRVPDLNGCSESDRQYAEVTLQLSRIYESRVRTYPRYAEFRHLLHFDLMQYFNTMRYSCLLNRHLELLNVAEHELYLPHAMHMMSFCTLDLMCSPDFDIRELGHVREALWRAQCMGRVGNLLSTWQREIPMADFTSGVFSRAVIAGDLTVAQLRQDNAAEVERAIIAGGHEKHYLNRWFYHRELLKTKIPQVRTVDLKQVLESQELFLQMHLGCRGLI